MLLSVSLAEINDQVLAAHEAGNLRQLPALYRRASQALFESGDIDPACFFLTQAYIYALDQGDPQAIEIHTILVSHGREI